MRTQQEPKRVKGPKPEQIPRGKKSKLKKMKQKYGDQDMEERRLRAQLIGTRVIGDEEDSEDDNADAEIRGNEDESLSNVGERNENNIMHMNLSICRDQSKPLQA